MSEVRKKCKYKSEVTGWKCPYEVLPNSKDAFCIFHERTKDKDIKRFNEGIQKILQDKDSDAYHFEGFFFPDSISFKGFKFKKSVFFSEARFTGHNTKFTLARFSGVNTDFSMAEFSNTIYEIDESEFTGKPHSFKVKFVTNRIDFSGAKFESRNTHFRMAKFLGYTTSFNHVEFLGETTDFSEAEFSGEVTKFSWTKLCGKNVRFRKVKFSASETVFSWAEFTAENADFNMAKFTGETTDFEGAVFRAGNAIFLGAEFSGIKTLFSFTKFLSGSVDFSRTKFKAEYTDFKDTEFSGRKVTFYRTEFLGMIIFDRTSFNANTSFSSVDLRKCYISDVNLTNVDFSLLNWDWIYKLVNETEGLKESSDESYLKLGEIYRQLKVQFHNKRDLEKAGMFHFREQECKRMACKLPKDLFKWVFLWLLRLSCGYGEKLRNVGLSTIALVLIFGVFYMFLGLHATNQAESLIFQYEIGLKSTASIGTIVKDYLTSVSFSLKGFFPLWRFQEYKLVGDFANLVAGFQFLLGAFFVGLFIYVFRRRMEK